MNERIGKLAVEAGARWDHGDWNMPSAVYFSERDLEKFAELIVRECVGVADDYVKDCTCEEHINCKHPRSAIGKKIREHFGVEE